MRSTRCRCRATATATMFRGPSRTSPMPSCWPTWCAPTGTTTGWRWPTASCLRRSRSWRRGTTVAAQARLIADLTSQIAAVEASLSERFNQHPDAELLLRLPGLGMVLAARVLAEFGDAPNRYADAKARRNYAGTAPITKASGTSEIVLARLVRNKRLFDACYQW